MKILGHLVGILVSRLYGRFYGNIISLGRPVHLPRDSGGGCCSKGIFRVTLYRALQPPEQLLKRSIKIFLYSSKRTIKMYALENVAPLIPATRA